MADEFSWKKLLSSPFTLMYWVKVTAIGLGICFLILDGYAIWKAFFKKPLPSTTQTADKIENYYYEPKTTFGCTTVKAYKQPLANLATK